MKKSRCMFAVLMSALLPSMVFAEGDGGNKDWAEEAAIGYEQKALKATESGDLNAAGIYLRMAQIKRDAGAAAKAGEEFSWDEYHKLNGELHGGKKDALDKKKETKGKDKMSEKSDGKKAEGKEKSKDKEAYAEKKGKEDPGAGFTKTAEQYHKKSFEALKAGETDKAGIYMELAKMKLDAAAAVREGKDYDWTQYHELVKELGE